MTPAGLLGPRLLFRSNLNPPDHDQGFTTQTGEPGPPSFYKTVFIAEGKGI